MKVDHIQQGIRNPTLLESNLRNCLSVLARRTRIYDASIVATMDDPLDRIQRKTLKKRETAGFTDFSGQFEFGAIGRYNINLEIAIPGKQTPIKVHFIRNYDAAE